MKGMNNKQVLDYQQKKIKDQDDQVLDIIGYSKKGKELGKDLKEELIKQNKVLDDVEKDVNLY